MHTHDTVNLDVDSRLLHHLTPCTLQEGLTGFDSADDADDTGDPDPEDEPEEPPAEKARKNAESLALIGKLLAKPGISTDLREDLQGYKTDIAEGEFEEGDRRYLRALAARLSKRR